MDLQSAIDLPREEDNESEDELTTEDFKLAKWTKPESDDEEDEKNHFDVNKSWSMLYHLPTCQLVIINEQLQKRLGLVIGINVSQEFPWKQLKYHFLRDYLFDTIENGSMFTRAFAGYDPDYHILIGYAPILTQNRDEPTEGDPFIFFINSDDAKMALAIIRNIELYERWLISKRLVKKPRRWVTLGSENEINLTLQQRHIEPIDVEIQSVYPLTIPASKDFSFRNSDDVRDGYVELVPSDTAKFDNIVKKRVTVGIQSAPDCVHLAQQTDPTFPSNAWAQYFFEIKDGEEELDVSSAEEDEIKDQPRSSKTPTPSGEQHSVPKKPVETSDQVALLLKTLEFNQIDMYRNDYPLICEKQIEHYTNPYLEETLCFANISKSFKRYVCGIDWYPTQSGLIVTSYTFSTAATVESVSNKVDIVQRAVLQPNPILMWSFSDNLHYKLEFETPVEVTVLSFCPYNPNLLIGGTNTGQLIIWDLLDRIDKLYVEESLTTAQSKYRIAILDFLKWAILSDEDSTVAPATTTSLEVSQKAGITGIYWLGQSNYINTFGKPYSNPDKNERYRYFISCSLDGTFSFWNLDAAAEKKQQGGTTRQKPKLLSQDESVFKNKVLKPIFTVAFNEPITGLVGDTSVFTCAGIEPASKRKNQLNYRIETKAQDPVGNVRQSMVISTMYGRIERVNWLGIYSETDSREIINPSAAIDFARVHDGPIIALKKNPFYPELFVSIGRTVFAVWKEDYNYSPIFWRKRISDLTAVAWSETRPSVLFLTRRDGYFEAWDLLARDDDSCLTDILGGGVITAISEHRPSEPDKYLGIGDYNSSFRMVKLPKSFYIPIPDELQIFKDFICKDQARKKAIQGWEQKYYETYQDIIEAKRQAEATARHELERIEKETILNAARKAKEAADEKRAEPTSNLPYTERMKRQWDALNLNRLLSILMSRKRVNAEQLESETALEKTRLAYESAKKESLYRILRNVGEEVANVRSRILPVEIPNLERNDMIQSAVTEILEASDNYNNTEDEANEIINSLAEFDQIPYIEYLHRGEQRRKILNKSLGGNTERLHWYTLANAENRLEECDWGYDYFLNFDLLKCANEENKTDNAMALTSYNA